MVRTAGRASAHGAARDRTRSSAVRFFRARASTSEKSPSGAGYWNARQVSATTNARMKPTIHLSKEEARLDLGDVGVVLDDGLRRLAGLDLVGADGDEHVVELAVHRAHGGWRQGAPERDITPREVTKRRIALGFPGAQLVRASGCPGMRQDVDSGSGPNPRLRGRYTDPMHSSWPKSDSVCSPDFFDRLLQGPTVVHIQTPRDQFVTCSPEQSLTEIVHPATVPYDEYDYLPVVRSSSSTQVIGVLCTRSAAKHDGHTARVKDCYEPLAERHLLGANASILEFVLHVDCHPCRFIVAGGRISGLVTLSDLQRLPVRMTLFALLTGFEMTLIEVIKRCYPEDEQWLSLLPPYRQSGVCRAIRRARAKDNFVHGLYATNLFDKLLIVQNFPYFDDGGEDLAPELRDIKCLRDQIAHADNFALTPERARKACRVARSLLALREQLCSRLPAE